jgi:hypothetical protein
VPPCGIGIIITPAAALASQPIQREPESVAQDQLLETHTSPEPQRA